MNIEYKYILEPYKPGGSNRYQCPFCGRKRCFTRYVNTQTGEYVGETCGRCNHENSCGEGLTPKEYYREHPVTNSYATLPSSNVTLGAKNLTKPIVTKPEKTAIEQLDPVKFSIDVGYVEASFSDRSVFAQWAKTVMPIDAFERVRHMYQLGTTRHGAVIFWQMDKDGRVRTGKAMFYHPNGHRVKQDDFYDFKKEHGIQSINATTYFIHSQLKQNKVLPDDWELHQCFFGEHLLPYYADADVALVESEKTAILFAAKHPGLVWLATGGCKQINAEKMKPLRGRRIYAFPDSGEYENWKSKMKELGVGNCSVIAEMEQFTPNTDIADVLLGEATKLA